MTKANITQYSATAGSNTDIDDIDIGEGMSPANVNNAIRALMSHLKNVDTGATTLTSPASTTQTITTLKTATVQYTDGDAAFTIANGGAVTVPNLIATTADVNGGSIDGATLGTNSAITQAVIDNVNINGATIGHTSDTDLMTLASGLLTVAGEVSMTTLDIGGTNVTSTASELNIMDGGTSASSVTVADADRVVYNDAGTMKQVAVTDLDTYVSGTTKTLTNKTMTTPTLTSPVINTGVSGSAIKDEDNMASDSATHLATQQSIKAYVDNVAGSASAAASSASSASSSATAAQAAQNAAETALDTFDDRFLGAKSTSGGDPSVDNDGNSLVDGALFFDTTNDYMKVYDLGNTTWRQLTNTTSDQNNINTVSGSISNVNTVAGSISNVNTVASNISTINEKAAAGANTDITSLKNTSLTIGRDNDNDIDFATDNNIIFRANGADQIKLQDGLLLPVTNNDVDLGSSSLKFKEGHFSSDVNVGGSIDVDGTTNLDNTDIDGTLVVDGTNISLDSTTTLNIDNSNTSNGITIGTATSAVPVSIGHTTSETTVNDNLTVTGNLTVNGTNNIGAGQAKNMVVNGAMQICQRTSSDTVDGGGWDYVIDRFCALAQASAGVFTYSQDADSPADFSKSLKVAVTTADSSLASGDIYCIRHTIEGYNTAHLNYGSSDAKTTTLSFWVKSSLTGTFGGAFNSEGNNRSYPFTYTISSANTWEKKEISIAGDQTGTWGTTNSHGIRITWGLGVGSTYSGSAGSWAGSEYFTATGATSVIGTNSSTWYLTGVMLEIGSSASDFPHLNYHEELAACQRYYHEIRPKLNSVTVRGYNSSGAVVANRFQNPVTMRAEPTCTVKGTWAVSNMAQPAFQTFDVGGATIGSATASAADSYFHPNGTDDYFTLDAEL